MDNNAIFISDFDVPSFATLYLQNVEGLRKDITLLRTVGMMQPWYVELLEDEELRRTADAAWKQTSEELGITGSGTPQFWEGSARFAWRLAQHYRGRRAVYALHGPMATEIPGPPYFVGLSEDLVRLDFTKPDLLRRDARAAIAMFPGGVELVSFTPDRDKVRAGEILGFTARWRILEPQPMARFAVAPAESAPPPGAETSEKKLRLVQGFPLLYCLRDLPPSPPGTAYEQRGVLVIPTNANGGPFGSVTITSHLWISFSPTYPPSFGDWVGGTSVMTGFHAYPTNPP
jgi:hypothetical protein